MGKVLLLADKSHCKSERKSRWLTYAQLGYSPEWINQRIRIIQARKELTDAWKAHGVEEGREYAILTDEVTRAWSGMSTRQHKRLKGLKKQNLRDNMSTLELALNMLAEGTTTELTKTENPQGLEENIAVAQADGEVAGDARRSIEARTRRSVITSENAVQLNAVVTNLIEGIEENEGKKT